MKTFIKLTILFVIICTFATQNNYIYCQTEYIPFQDSCIWSVNTHKYMTCGDTTINGKEYLKVYYHYENTVFEFDMAKAVYFCAIRNDTTNKRVFGIYRKAIDVIDESRKLFKTTDTTEFLLYNFSLNIGDTITVASFFFGNYIELWQVVREGNVILLGEKEQLALSNNDSLMNMQDGSIRKRILLNIIPEYHFSDVRGAQMWIEGIGSSNGLFTPSQTTRGIADLPYTQLVCFQQGKNILYKTELTSFDKNSDCYDGGFGGNIGDGIKLISKILTYPNPTEGLFVVNLIDADEILPCEGIICNSIGQELHRFTIYDNHTNINLTGFAKGMYFFQLIKNNKVIQTNKIILK